MRGSQVCDFAAYIALDMAQVSRITERVKKFAGILFYSAAK